MNALKAFDAAARCKGFTAAAQEISVSPAAISRHVGNLEDYLGVNLFERHHNEIELTRAGEQYFARIRSALDVIEDASRQMTRQPNSRQVSITALPTIAMMWLIPKLPRFQALHPRVEVQISTNVAQIDEIDMELDGVDVALHFSISDISSDYCHLLFETELQAICSPELVSASPGLREPRDILSHVMLHTMNGLTQWHQWLQAAGLDPSAATRQMKFGNSSLAMKAAIDGLGLALSESAFIKDEVAVGRLVSPFEMRLRTGNKYFMTINPARARSPGVQAFHEWVLAEVGEAAVPADDPQR